MLPALRHSAFLAFLGGLAVAVSCSVEDQLAGDPADGGSGAISGASGASNSAGGSSNGGRAGSSSRGGSSGNGSSGRGGSAGAGDGETGGGGGTAGNDDVADRLDIYWVDVEGGAATIIRTPDGKVVLTDTGFPGGRDAARILSLLEEQVGAERIDHLIITHYHADHVGGAAEVAAGIDVTEFIDHGESVEEGEGEGYPELALDRRRSVVPGDTISLGDVTLTIVQSNGQGIADPLGAGATNPACEGADPGIKEPDEDAMSVGYVVEFGRFRFVDLGDLTWGYQHELACPVNKLGEVDLFQVPHHGFEISSPPQLLSALNPIAAVISNGPDKGNDSVTYERLANLPALEAIWAIHRSEENDAEHNPPEERIANVESGASDEAHFVHATVLPNGEFRIENSRNGHSETYQAR
jgi:beta-lactamase superfamily II metal-dependent hydrolase